MKKILLLLLSMPALCCGQAEKTAAFSFSPMKWNLHKVNGVAAGLGHYKLVEPADRDQVTTINGFNLELNPFSPLILLMFQSPFEEPNAKVNVVMNGFHLSTGGFNGRVTLNGVGASLYHMGNETNGFTITGTYNATKILNGLHISGISNFAGKSNGVLISLFNYSEEFNGLAIGVVNQSTLFKGVALGLVNLGDASVMGVQIGLINVSAKNKGLQIGLWNKNEKRSLPLINW